MLRATAIATTGCAALALAACGSSDSESQSAYCEQRNELRTQTAQIRDTNVIEEGTNTFKACVDTALTQTERLVESAKSDFPQETRDLDMAITSVRTSLSTLDEPAAGAEARASALANLPGQLDATVGAARRLRTAVQDKCS